LERKQELLTVNEYVDPILEITEITDRISKQPGGGKALLFTNNGTDFPVLINALGSMERICLALGRPNLEEIGKELGQLLTKLTGPKDNIWDRLKFLPELSHLSSWIPRVLSSKGRCQDVVIRNPDLSVFPILKCWPEDGGRFITLPMVNTKDPVSGVRNVGMYRMQVLSESTTGMHWHRHKTGARHFEEYRKLGQKMPSTVALGGEPVYTYAATSPLPDNVDEYLLAGFLRRKQVRLVKCITNDLEVPEDADIVIEGYVDPSEEMIWEGPFGDHTGHYSLPDWYPAFHVTCITHRNDAVYPATIVGIPPMEDAWIAKATERIFLAPIKIAMLPEIMDMDLPPAGVAHNLSIVKIKKSFPGQALKVMNALWGAGQMMFNKILVVVDEDVNIHDYLSLAKMILPYFDPEKDLHFSLGPLDILDHSSDFMAYGGKMCIDASKKFPEEDPIPESTEFEIMERSKLDTDLKKELPELADINTDLMNKGIPVAIISIDKVQSRKLKDLAPLIFRSEPFSLTKIVLVVDKEVDVYDIESVIWLTTSNIDPRRDCLIYPSMIRDKWSHLMIDGTRKTTRQDNFRRDWPNIIISDDKTIKSIDSRWEKLGICDFIPSPSLKFKSLFFKGGATVKE
jgi:4-hydroxy-3-polyprenylbenzoate decarboxylase